jgi:hypothetical protein
VVVKEMAELVVAEMPLQHQTLRAEVLIMVLVVAAPRVRAGRHIFLAVAVLVLLY